MQKGLFLLLFSLVSNINIFCQSADSIKLIEYTRPKEYIVDTVIISGIKFLDQNVLANMSGISKGTKMSLPGDEATKLIKKYWEYGLFDDVQILFSVLYSNHIVLEIYLKERPRITKFSIEGVSKSDQKDLKEKLNFRVGSQATESVLSDAKTIIRKFYTEKGFFNVHTDVVQNVDTTKQNGVEIILKIKKNKRVKINDIIFTGNTQIKDSKLRKSMKKTKRRDWKFWNSSKYIEANYKEDKGKLIEYYNEKGYRDAKIISDSIKVLNEKRINIYINLYEGNKYYFRNIKWLGNTVYPTDVLDKVLGLKKGDIYNQKKLDKRLQTDDDAVSSLYLDNGYLFFNVTPVEINVENDSIDFEMRIYEGKQASFNEIIITGNTKTNEHVVRRELRTLPGELFSKSDIIRSVRELATLGHFEPEKIEPVPIPNPANSTVDLQYKLVERANDQLELSGGWGGSYYGFIGTLGISFNNFSYRNFFNWKEWRPVPSGDGQQLSFHIQTNGKRYSAISATFADPWFGNKKPNNFSLSGYYRQINSVSYNSLTSTLVSTGGYYNTAGITVALGQRLKWPDDYFIIQRSIAFERYKFKDWGGIIPNDSSATIYGIIFGVTLSRNSLDQFIYPRTGSLFSVGLSFTPPYSLFSNKDYTNLSSREKYKWTEYYKWTIKGETYTSIVGNLVFMTKAQFGLIGRYNKKLGYPVTESYSLGGSGLVGYSYTNQEIIPMRGYTDGALTGRLYDRFTCELRYPITLKEQATIYGFVFAEGGNTWLSASEFNPFYIKRSIGVGIRVFLPMFGMLGFDLGYGFDKIDNKVSGWQPQFVMGQQY